MPPEGALALLERAKSGDKDAFGALAEEHRAALLRLCWKMTGSREEAEDLVQETLLRAYTHIAEFELRSSLSTWLHRIATNAALDHQKSRKPWDLEKRWEWFRENGELVQQLEQSLYLSPERAVEVKEVAATCVNCVMMSLPEKQRAAIALCDQLGVSREEAAKAIGASVASVKTELHRGRKKMAEVYEHHCQLVDEGNECDGCLWAGRVQRKGAPKQSASSQQQKTTTGPAAQDTSSLPPDVTSGATRSPLPSQGSGRGLGPIEQDTSSLPPDVTSGRNTISPSLPTKGPGVRSHRARHIKHAAPNTGAHPSDLPSPRRWRGAGGEVA